jgi:DNA-directed RNA polymerase beta' subunit
MSIYKDAEISETRIKDLLFRGKKYYPEYIENYNFADEIPGPLFLSILFPHNFCYTKTTETDPLKPDVLIEDGIILPESGPFCVKTVGAKTGSIVHELWKNSQELALHFISDLQQITDRWLPTHGFSMGIHDCFASNESDVAKVLIETRMKVAEIIRKGESKERMEMEINAELNNAMIVGPKLAKNSMARGERNSLNIMRNSGAKGSLINLAQIVAFVGQQNIKGKRMPMQLSHNSRCLPCFLSGDMSPEARGFIANNYLRGLTPAEAFFHAAAGRDGVIATAIKSVTGETPIIITVNGVSKYVLIGDWIDELLKIDINNVEKYTEREMELLNVEKYNIKIPTTDESGNVSWGPIKNITRHDPGKELYKIKTLGGRDVIVTESKSLLIWDGEKFIRMDTPLVKIGDYVPTTGNLTKPVTKKYIDLSIYFPKSDYIHGTEFIIASYLINTALENSKNGKVSDGWWKENNGSKFYLPYDSSPRFRRVITRSNIDNIKYGCIYPYSASREVQLPNKLVLNRENGLFFGLFLAEGNADIPSGYVAITNTNKNIQDFVVSWFGKYSISNTKTSKINHIGGLSEGVRGYSRLLAKLLTEMVGHGARNKYVPDEAFMAPDEFIIGLIDGYISGDGTITKNSINVSSASKRLIEGISMLLSRIGIFSKIGITSMKKNNLGTVDMADINTLSIRGQWALKFADKISLTEDSKMESLLNMIPTLIHRNYKEQNDVVLDKIVSIEKISIEKYINDFPKYKGKVYDLTVPSTLNFGLANGLHVVDTADTGYMQKKIARKVEDVKVWIDGTLRDANGRIISFMYGDDGMDAKKLVSVKGLNKPFFVNPISLARQLNSDAKRSGEVNDNTKPRKMNDTEIKLLLGFLSFSGIDSPVIKLTLENARETLMKIIVKVEIYECKIPDLIVKICEFYNSSKAPYGLAAGLVSGSCIGEPGTQMVLNTFHFAGLKGKDVSNGVPRYKELINTTKTKDQKSPSCEIYFNHPDLLRNTAEISILEIDKIKNLEKITELRASSLKIIKGMGSNFEETYIHFFLIDYQLRYLPNTPVNINEECKLYDASPVGLLTYEEYSEEWWVTLSKDLERIPINSEPESWVIILHFDVEKLYSARIDLEDICFAIESITEFVCIPSPNIIGRIELYCTLSEMKDYIETKVDFRSGEHNYVNENNIEYYLCRDVIIDFIKNIRISGIQGISKIYPREILESKEYILDAEGNNFLEVLTAPHVDFTRTTCDDMHSILSVLGIAATRNFLFSDITRVISFDGTYVDPRHIAVLVDSMTVNGNLDAASRDGIQRDVGPNAKIMFEKNIDNAATACAFTEKDKMVSMASAVMYGKLAKVGSGAVTIRDKEKTPITV